MGLWACAILHISFQSCLSPPNATLRLDSPFYPSVFIIAHAANHLTCGCSCSCTWVPSSSPARLPDWSTAALQQHCRIINKRLQPAKPCGEGGKQQNKKREADKHPQAGTCTQTRPDRTNQPNHHAVNVNHTLNLD